MQKSTDYSGPILLTQIVVGNPIFRKNKQKVDLIVLPLISGHSGEVYILSIHK